MSRGIPGSTPGHGTVARYSTGCRCDECRASAARRGKRNRIALLRGHPGLVPCVVVTRRIHALSAIGWTYEALASRLGVTHQNVGYLAGRTSGMVQRGIAQAVIRLYDELSMTPGPSSVARDRAAARGWPPPLAWDEGAIDDPDARPNHTSKREKRAAWRDVDEVAVARAINGARIELTGPERESAVEILVRTTDLSDKQIAARLDMWPETVFRIRKRLGLDSNYGTARRAS